MAGFVLSFALILYLSIRKVSIARVMLLATIVMALTSGMDARGVASTVWTAFKDGATLELAGAVLAIGLFSTLMREFGFLDRTVAGLTALLGNVKAVIMSVPALIGCMPVLGGAALSAPLVDKLGEPIGLPPDVMAAANLAFRHGMLFIVPFSTNLILASQLSGFSTGQLIGKLWPVSAALWGIGYLTLLRKAGAPRPETAAAATPAVTKQSRLSGFAEFALYGGPLLAALLLGLVLKWPLWLSLGTGAGLAVALALVQKRPMPSLQVLLKGANLSLVSSMFWIMAFKGFITASPVFPAAIARASSRGVPAALLAVLIPMAFGFGSASQTTTLGVLMPLLVPAALPAALKINMVSLVYVSSFTSYFFSPLHLCQVLTCQYFKTDLTRVYRRNWPILVGLLAIIAGFYLSVRGV